MEGWSLRLSTVVNWVPNRNRPIASSCFGFTTRDHHRRRRLRLQLPTKHISSNPSSTSSTITVRPNALSFLSPSSSWDDKPFEVLPNGRIAYLDEQDVVTFLDPPNQLIPLDPSSYNPASYLWKKIEDIPEERRPRLLRLLNPRLISKAWEIAGARYDDPKLAKKCASSFLSNENGDMPIEFWNCRTSGGPTPFSLMNFFKKALFYSKESKLYGRFVGESFMEGISNSFAPLYFTVSEVNEVMSTEQPCDLAYEFGDGLLNLSDYPPGFPKPAKHPWPFNDEVVVYIRHVGPGVLVGQAWQEGEALEALPKKLCGEILMVKNFSFGADGTGTSTAAS